MRKSAVVIPLLALVAGVIGFLIRQVEVTTAFEAGTGFAKRGEAITAVLIAVSVAAVVLAVAAGTLISRRRRAESDYSSVFSTRGMAYFALSLIMGIVWLAADAMYFLDVYNRTRETTGLFAMTGGFPILDAIFVFLAAVSAISVISLAWGARIGRGGTGMMIFSVIPSVFFSFWLILLYKNNASNPVILQYAYHCLAIAAAALSAYFSAGFVYKKVATGRMLFSYLVTIFFCTTVLADDITLPLKLIFAVAALGALVSCVVYLKNLKRKDEA